MLLRLLLIEDSQTDAVKFINQIQQNLNEVEIQWCQTLGEAMAELETAQTSGLRFDQIWLDPGLPDLIGNSRVLGKAGEASIAKALKTLKTYVPEGELRIISSPVLPNLDKVAQNEQVQILDKQTAISNTEVLAIVQQLLASRSNSSVKVEQARLEGKIANIEHAMQCGKEQLDQLETRLGPIEKAMDSINVQLASVRDEMRSLKDSRAEQRQMKMQMWALFFGLLTTIITVLGTNIIPKLIDRSSPEQKPAESPKPKPSDQSSSSTRL